MRGLMRTKALSAQLGSSVARFVQRCSCSSSSVQGAALAPAPIRIGFTEHAGRGVFATRRIAAGELIHSEKPVVAHPALANMGKVCSLCLKRLTNTSGGGQTIVYCSPECAANAKGFSELEESCQWLDFHEHCRKNDLRFPLLMKRLACMVAANIASPDVLDILYPPSPPCELPERWVKERQLLVKALSSSGMRTASLEFLTDSWYAAVLARIHLNTFRVETLSLDPSNLHNSLIESISGGDVVGSAVYILPSMFNHSCDANVNIAWPESALAKLEALRTIEEGEELYITYIDAGMARDARRAILQEAYGFHCQCPRCLDGD